MSTLENIGLAAIAWSEASTAKYRARVERRRLLKEYCDDGEQFYEFGSGEDDAIESAAKEFKSKCKECASARAKLVRAINKHTHENR